jgi:hypothetical protein
MRYVSSKSVSRALGAALLIGALGACDFIEPVTSNPNAVPVATVDQLFTGIQVNTWFFGEAGLSRITSLWTQQMTGTDRQFTSLDNYLFTEQDGDDAFFQLYTQGGLVDLKQAIAQAEEAGRAPYAGILKIHQAYLFGMGASIWGDIPYSEAVNPEIEQPALDDQADVYASVQALLTEAIGDLSGGGSGPGAVDMSLGGDVDAWKAVAHTLKARLYLHWAEVSSGNYASALSEANQGVKSVADNWSVPHSTTSTENNSWFQFMRDRSGYIGAGDYLLPMMRADDDPRIASYYSTVDGEYVSPAEGAAAGTSYSILSETVRGAADAEFPLVTCSENYFIISEAQHAAGQTAEAIAAAKDALACQESFLGVDLTDQKAAFDGLSGSALLDQIMYQKYTSLFLNIESWNDYKRTCRPALTPRVAEGVPARLFYPEAERQTNPNIPDVGAQGASGYGYRAGANDNDPSGCG